MDDYEKYCYSDDCDKQNDSNKIAMCLMCYKPYHQSCVKLKKNTAIFI